ncbi:MAG: tRNA (guanosine(46)-N7)-methyltransferase TrmB [Oscillospiraceae bacterium]
MRMRRKKHREERLEACGNIFTDVVDIKGKYIEIGCGKGDFITELAKLNPQTEYNPFEKNADVALLAGEKALKDELKNVKFCIGDARPILQDAPEGSCLGIYINFCDPWEKEGHRKRRLTHQNFLALYRKILVPNGEIHFKTDNRKLFQFSLNSFSECRYQLKNISLDLHNDKFPENIVTEYEQHFSDKGFPIFRLEAFVNTSH